MYHYELLDFDTGNVLRTFATEREALEAVVGLSDANTADATDDVALVVHAGEAMLVLVEGTELVAHARAFLQRVAVAA